MVLTRICICVGARRLLFYLLLTYDVFCLYSAQFYANVLFKFPAMVCSFSSKRWCMYQLFIQQK